MIRLIIETDPVCVKDEGGNILKEFSSKDPGIIFEFITGKADLYICNDPTLYKQLSDMEHSLVKGSYKRAGEDLEHLPDDYVYPFGKNKGKRASEVPTSYKKWWEAEVPRKRW
jgi:hypothetical protein